MEARTTPIPSDSKRRELQDLVDRYKAHSDFYTKASGKYNEHSCRDDFINPLLSILGWDVGNLKGAAPQYREVIAENYSSESERPDYTLAVGGNPIYFVEAKKPSVDIVLEDDPSMQARKYGWNAKQRIAVLTNFEDLIIFDTSVMPRNGEGPSVARFRRYGHDEYVARFDEIYELLSRDSAYSGHFNDVLDKELGSLASGNEHVDEVFLKQINQWRIELAQSLLRASSAYQNEELLNDAIQDFINQIVFLRICEDKNLPVYHRLIELDSGDTAASITELLKAADRRYNSGLFSQTSALQHLDDGVVRNIIEALYYPQSPYLFDIIDSNLFGQIYEMFLAERVIVGKDGEPELAKKKEYKDRSVVATPAPIAKYIVEKSLSPLCDGATPQHIKATSCADIACGSGIFLIEAYQYLLNKTMDWYYQNDPEKLVAIGDGRYKLPFEEKKEILVSCIYGIDIDPHAVEVAKFSLLIKLIEGETGPTVQSANPILPNLDSNIMVGNSLVSPQEANAKGASDQDKAAIIPFDWASINSGKPFEAVFGNPPYVKTEDMHSLLPRVEMEVYKSEYASSYKQFDKYFLFVEQSLKHLAQGGYACFIIPNKFFKIASGKLLRKTIATGSHLVSIDDFGDAQLFADKTIYSSIVLLSRDEQDEFSYRAVSSVEDLYGPGAESTIFLPASDLGGDPWKLTTDIGFIKRLKAIEEDSAPLTNHVEIFNGIQTSAERHRSYWFLDEEILSEDDNTITFKRAGKQIEIEKSLLRRFFKPTEEHGFNSYSALKCDKWLLFPYDKSGKLIPIDTMKKTYPLAWAYLESIKHELWPKQLKGDGTRDVPNATEQTWYQYGRTQALASFNDCEKIIVGILSDQPLYYIDTEDWVIASGGTAGYCAIKMKEESPYCLEYIQAWLTNQNTERIFEMIGSDFEGGFKSRGTSLLKTLRFVEPDLEDDDQRKLYDEVVELSKRIRRINEELKMDKSRKETVVLTREKEESIARIEELVNIMYAPKEAE